VDRMEADGLSDRRDALKQLLADAGYPLTDAPLLQPASVFLDLSGEDIRRRLFLTIDAHGAELCLRPEFTIPLSRAYLAGTAMGLPARMGYEGPVFRHRAGESGEFRQAGVESFARDDHEAADAEVAALAWQAAQTLGGHALVMRMGDIAILDAALAGIGLPTAFMRRLKRSIAAGNGRPDGKQEPDGLSSYSGVLKALEGADPKGARAFVEDLLRIAGVSETGGRSAKEIADRFLARAGGASENIAADQLALIDRLLAIDGDPDMAAEQLRHFATDTGIGLSPQIDALEARIGFMAAAGVDVGDIAFSPGFARSLDYYTGMVFEIVDPARAHVRPLVGGGRYDRLLERLGAPSRIPAVGFSIWIERFPMSGVSA
jgi:ATP phosphoribosyltransferase regulatory subunit